MTRQQVKIPDIVIPKYLPLFNDRKTKHIILTSGRSGTKSSYAAIRANYQIVSDPNGSVVVLRKHHNKLRKTVYKEMLRGINRLKLPKKKFAITKSPMEITYRKYGTTMYFIDSANEMLEADPKMYRWTWLGESIGVDELIYYMYGDRHRGRPDRKKYGSSV